jgi:signal transduction histidine kinase
VRALRLLLLPAGAAVGIAAEWVSFGWDNAAEWLPDLVVGWTLIGCGLVGWSRRPESRSGPLLAATGFAWFAGNFASEQALYLHRGPLIHLVLSYPSGRLGGRMERGAVAIGYGAALIPAIWSSEIATFALAAFFLLVACHRYLRALGRERRASLAALLATAFVGAVLVGSAAARLLSPTSEVTDATLLVYEAALCTLAAGLLAGLLVEPWAPKKVTDLVVDLGHARSGVLRDALARALGDPTLEVGYWLDHGYVDSEGRPLVLPPRGSDRKVTRVDRDGEAVAVLVHDPAVLDDPGLSVALARAARLAAANARLQAEVRAQVVELGASRRRLVHAGDEERRRLERRLHETVERRLTELASTLEDAEVGNTDSARLRSAKDQLARTLDEVRDLAAGLHPGVIERSGLQGALASLVARSPVQVDLKVTDGRVTEELSTAAYFVCSEALANIIKYAHASRAAISVSQRGERLLVEITDDGAGGAVIGGGTGLSGLADRVETLGGTLELYSPPGRGTRLSVELPLGLQAS